ncbi:subclass B3 metallo-beta-lactamase [Sphingomonas montanisoli]|uniref:Subclass B3 metallo-beta-lactamase n=1 Tax=Sphingomonas montanisoli TaxID=2606412 RepID=A0A5D9BXE0_9SPHN|nr:subclass B3 metallo-beta-lactamase [Sphingomonas montanisoli]TZG24159.1 subclass B3 metallo-beta-lactamase [Sphingomonas montanisoli]
MRNGIGLAVGIAGALLGSMAWGQGTTQDDANDPLLAPVSADFAKQWLTPQTPIKVFGRTYLVGYDGLTVALIKTDDGLVLIDGAVPQAVRGIEANIRTLGFDIKDVKYILSTEPHYDHAGGIAALQRDSGARVVSSIPAAAELRTGKGSASDPQASWLSTYPGVPKVLGLRDGMTIRIGGMTIRAVATPSHTAGSMSWTWKDCEGDVCKNIVFGSSLSPTAAPDWKYSDRKHAPWVATFRATLTKVRKLPCDILFSAHPMQSGGDEKYAAFTKSSDPNPYIDPASCSAYADRFEKALNEKIAKGD